MAAQLSSRPCPSANGAMNPDTGRAWPGATRRLVTALAAGGLLLAINVSTARATPPPNMFTATAGVAFVDKVVGGYTTTNCGPDGCQIFNRTVTIDWGDGSQSTVQATTDCPTCDSADWTISGSHKYHLAGTYPAFFSGVVASGGQHVPIAATVTDDPNSIGAPRRRSRR
jgi:hypothetical protein